MIKNPPSYISSSDIYAYTFETPMGTKDSDARSDKYYRCTTANDCLNGVMHLVDASGKKKCDERTALLGMLDKFPSWMTPLLLMDYPDEKIILMVS